MPKIHFATHLERNAAKILLIAKVSLQLLNSECFSALAKPHAKSTSSSSTRMTFRLNFGCSRQKPYAKSAWKMIW